MYEDVELDSGVAYNTENFDDDFMSPMDICCDGIFEECPMDSHTMCPRWKECREEYETL